MYAATKLSVVLALSLVYTIFAKWMIKAILGIGNAEQSKSWILFVLLVIVTIYRDKHEKKIVGTYDPSKLHFGRASLTPLVYLSFTIMTIADQSLLSFLGASLYQIGFFYFYYDDAMELLYGTNQRKGDSPP